MDYLKRIEKLRKKLHAWKCDTLLIEDPINIYYLTGLDLSAGRILLNEKDAELYVDGRYFESCQKSSCIPVHLSDEKPLEQALKNAKYLGFDSSLTTYKGYLVLKKIADKQETIQLVHVDAPLKLLRAVKDEEELTLLKSAASLNHAGMQFALSMLNEGISEMEIAMELDIFWKRRGSKAVSFDPIIAFGANSSMPHYRAGPQKLREGDIVLIDIGTELNRYHSDMTRTHFFGEPDPQLKEIHKIVEQAQQKALDLCRPGVTLGELDKAARDHITAHGYGPNFTHSLGHGVGLEIHEYPTVKNTPPFDEIPLEKNMVLTIEPGIYVPGLGGVRIEDTVIVNSSGKCTLLGISE